MKDFDVVIGFQTANRESPFGNSLAETLSVRDLMGSNVVRMVLHAEPIDISLSMPSFFML